MTEAAAKPRWGGAPTEKCKKCGKTVYAAEMTKMENQIWHIECLRCVECNKKLAGANWGGFVPPDNAPYCNVHHKRLLQAAGSAIEFSGSTTDSKWAIRVATEGAQGADQQPGGGSTIKKEIPEDQKCQKCGGRSYPAESVKMEGRLYHENCLRCVEEGCNKKLNGSNWGGFVGPNNNAYCKIHLKRLVSASGSSADSTGSTIGSKWNQQKPAAASDSSDAPSSGDASASDENAGGDNNSSSDSGSSGSSSAASSSSGSSGSSSSAATSSPASSGAKPKWGGAPSEKCVKCGKTVYSAEMAKMEGQIWHDNCLRCAEEGCNKKLSGANWGGFVPPDNTPYCKVHHQRLLQSKGSSIEFSGSTTNSKWKINSTQ